ncbi:lactate dehydrogenase [Oceanicola sp. 22II-s10i]|uniref:Ldh family oxidoreductase n=1 Tax=Oceanicola sp. 22II-s10i TaxID=1317116 RepID=UPI000B525A94|nr:Ldh family oxidoreductase [Oceanicola sp. 22II-s10i]OWU85625.1 lactate dehydrogenase [Oceanicola sp. 22II-s10i]
MAADYETHQRQIAGILASWGMPQTYAEQTAEVMAWTDLHGIDSHGISMLTVYHRHVGNKRLRMEAVPTIATQGPVNALVDGDGGLGHAPARLAMSTAIEKARTIGIGIAVVRNSAHFGACGFYANMAAEAGLIGMVTTSASLIQVAPAGGAQARFGTDPLAFAAPGEPGRPFLLDMATTTVAAGRIRNKANEGLDCPPGWVLTKDGLPSVNPLETQNGGYLTSLGGSPEGSSYKGYGLSAMVNILAAGLSGATFPTDPQHTKKPQGMDIGHFFLAIDPGMFRPAEDFRAEVAAFCDALRATPPVDSAQPVMVAGDPERKHAAERGANGIPVAPGLKAKLKEIAEESGAEWLLD